MTDSPLQALRRTAALILVVPLMMNAGCRQESKPSGPANHLPVASQPAADEGTALSSAASPEAGTAAPASATREQPGGPPPSDETDSRAIEILLWNTESENSDPAVIAGQLKELCPSTTIAGLSEVDPSAFELYRLALGPDFRSINGTSGNMDRLQLIYDARRLELLDDSEPTRLGDIEVNSGRHRSPLIALFHDRTTGEEFHVMVVHQARGNEEMRNQQARGIREWARNLAGPAILVGDWNYDWDFPTEKGNQSFDELVRDNILVWVRPKELIDSNWFDGNGDGQDDYPDNLLDGAFVSGAAREWNAEIAVIVREGDFPDDESTADHRPLRLKFWPGGR